jgi:tetratricopeptide (TPR) repeat protein/predicted Ser/Thr protein kinase
VIGAGGAGVVYAARDPELCRTIALKVLRPEIARRPDARARLVREAQALARLRHPNIVSVYDVGAVDDTSFIALEYVDGMTFGEWLAASPRTWRRIVDVLARAGRGLAAAHAAGLVHRDFKPSNLLVGRDGRVLVTDFGLARIAAERDDREPDAAPVTVEDEVDKDMLGRTITRSDRRIGTPAYMAPEQHAGGAADARSDQFSLAVTLHEALFGESPSVTARMRATGQARPARRAVPPWLVRVIARGLEPDPARRHPTVDAMVAALVRGTSRRRRWWSALVAGNAALLIGVVFVARQCGGAGADEVCGGAARELAGAWDSTVRAEVGKAFAASPVSYAADTWARVAPLLDDHARRWASMHGEACLATRRGEQSEAMLDRRMVCLGERRQELARLVGLLRQPDKEIVEHAVGAALALGRIDACADLELLTRGEPPPAPPEARARVAAARALLAQAHALEVAGKRAQGLAVTSSVAAEVDALAYMPLRAELSFQMARLRTGKEELASLEEAIWAAEASGHDRVTQAALIDAVGALSDLDRFDDARALGRRAEAALLRAGSPDDQRAQLLNNLGLLLLRQGDHAGARSRHEEALALRRRLHGESHPDVAQSLSNLGNVAYRMGESSQAMAHYEAALAIEELVMGAEHPAVARNLNNMGVLLVESGRVDEALSRYERALAIREGAFGPKGAEVASTLGNMGNAYKRLGRYDEAVAVFERAIAIREEVLGPEHTQVALLHNNLGNVWFSRKDMDRALLHYQRSADMRESALGPDHVDLVSSLLNVCSVHHERGRTREALATCERALAIAVKSLGPDHPRTLEALQLTAPVRAAAGRSAQAIADLERVHAALRRSDSPPDQIAAAELALADVLWRHGGDRARARRLASDAQARLAAGGAEVAELRRDVERWLRAHGARR